MNELVQMTTLLNQKKDLFLEFEQATEELCYVEIDEMESLMDQRLKLQERIDELTQQQQQIYQSMPELEEIVVNPIEKKNLTGDFKSIQELSIQIKGTIQRIIQISPMLQRRIERERDDLLEKLQNSKKSTAAVAQKYYQTVSSGVRRPFIQKNGKTV